MAKPDFNKYSEQQLRQILTRIDRERFPERVEEIHARLALLQAEGPPSLDTQAAKADEEPAIASLWRRFGAAIIDCLIIVLVGHGLGFLLATPFEAIGSWGLLVGFAITIGYFGSMESRFFQGQTLGKLALNIRVISASGAPLSVRRSISRSAVFHAPYFLSGASMGPLDGGIEALGLHLLLPFALQVGIAYLLVFNRRTRQSLHDLLVGAVVAHAGSSRALTLAPLWRGHWAALGALGVVLIGSHVYVYSTLGNIEHQPLVEVQRQVGQLPGVRSVQVVETETMMSSGESSRSMAALAIVDTTSGAEQALARRIAAIALTSSPARQLEMLSVTVARGYNIGIASRWRLARFNASPDAWRDGRVGEGEAAFSPAEHEGD